MLNISSLLGEELFTYKNGTIFEWEDKLKNRFEELKYIFNDLLQAKQFSETMTFEKLEISHIFSVPLHFHALVGLLEIRLCFPFCFYLGFLSKHLQFTGQQGKGEAISLTLLCQFHPLHRDLDISQELTHLCTQLQPLS